MQSTGSQRDQTETSQTLSQLFDDFFREATRLQLAYASKIKLLIGVEIDWIRPSSKQFIEALLSKYKFDIFVGSVHHVHTVPIDYDHDLYINARQLSGGTDEKLCEDYFDLQYEMLTALMPPVVGHFDLIRLFGDRTDACFKDWSSVWQKISRNLNVILGYGGVIEINSAALRKGLKEPYPKADICKVYGLCVTLQC